MSYQSQTALAEDPDYQGRVRACSIQQAQIFVNDQRPAFVSYAQAVIRQGPEQIAMFHLTAAAPGIADKVDTGEGIDQSRVTDDEILSCVQAAWPVASDTYYAEDGSPIG